MKKYFTLTAIFLLCRMFFTPAYADSTFRKLDQLLGQFCKSAGRHRTALANEVMQQLTAVGYGDQVLFTDADPSDSVTMTVCYYSAEYLLAVRQYDPCIRYASMALPLTRGNGDYTWQSESLNLLAQAHFYKSDYISALTYAEEMFQIDNSHGDQGRVCSTLNTIACIFLGANQPEQAKTYIERAIEADRQADDHSHRSAILGVASDVSLRLGDARKALDLARRAYETDRQAGSRKAAIRLTQMAAANLGLGETEQARRQLDEALPTLQEYDMMPTLGIGYNTYGQLMAATGPKGNAAARSCYQKARDLFRQHGDLYNLLHSLYGLYQCSRESNPQEALAYIDEYTRLRDSIYHQEVQSMLCYYATRFHQDELLSQVNTDNRQNRLLLTGLSVGGGLLLIIIGVLAYLLWHRRKVDDGTEPLRDIADHVAETEKPSQPADIQQPTDADTKFLVQLTDVVYAQMSKGIDIDQIAGQLGFSPSQLRRKVSAVTGKSPATYIMQIRLTYAQRLLDKNPEMSIGEIAFKCGFSDNSHFTHAFQKMYGISPTQYIRRVK